MRAGHETKILSEAVELSPRSGLEFSPQLRDKIWEWPEARVGAVIVSSPDLIWCIYLFQHAESDLYFGSRTEN